MRKVFLGLLCTTTIVTSLGFFVSNSEWEEYKNTYSKSYGNIILEIEKRIVFAVNGIKIRNHNNRYKNNLESFGLGVNQFSDLTFLEFVALFSPTAPVQPNGIPYQAPNVPPQNSFSYAAQGFVSPVQNQGITCNSGWAYATATALQIFDASVSGNLNTQLLSAQNLIDCAGGSKACINQNSQVAFDYLTKENQKLYPETEYRNNPLGTQGMCVTPVSSTNAKTLKSYSNIPNRNDKLLKTVVNYVAPVVTEINPATFEFMQYKEGIFTQPESTKKAAHYITVVGYESAIGTQKGYWLIQNSFGKTWGENGMMKIEINSAKPIAKSAIFPLE